MSLVRLEDVTFTYAYSEKPALRDVSLELKKGLLYGVIGANTSGKSTLCNLIRGLIPTFHPGMLDGKVEIMGRNLADWNPADLSRSVGFVFENPFTQISGIKDTVFEEIAFGLENLGVPRAEIFPRVLDVIDRLDLRPLIGKNPNELSGGQRQKVAFASIVAMDTEFVVIDEPTSQLDPDATEAVFEIIADLKRRGKSILLVEHKVDLLAQYADRIVVLGDGQVLGEGSPQEILISDVMDLADVSRPEVTDLGLALAGTAKALPVLPIVRQQAFEVISARLQG
ncbi:ABC transporter ATP-binding protein [Mesorhizobium sp. B2-3-11]|uniref:energy-coupling factor ABC transporter ATP-binding protein n=1 Tax=Mesorhizobium sp. B2-3-11 TaxID=2589953 RepID=UPI00112627F1|nr:ABC transporter ATP-binding protein [Mesorhizobium sp. B2-3-11]TPM07049.1 ABC transporter ATP-binding protein [Mesorhizobium sp. B2-3-11]